MEDYGETYLEKIEDGRNFWDLFDELIDDISGFLNNRNYIVDSYKEGNMYGLRVTETDSMYQRHAAMDKLFCSGSFYLLPCFIIKEKDEAFILWVHTRARNKGLGTKLVELSKIKYVYNPLPESVGFWKKFDVKVINRSKPCV